MSLIRLNWLVVFGCLLVTGGCSSDETAWVSGKVTFAGKAIPKGVLRFFPLEGTSGNGAGAKIIDGQYEVSPEMAREKGLVAGGYRVMVVASRNTGRKVPHPAGEGMMAESIMYIPTRYNQRTQLQAEFKPGENSHDILLDR